MSKGDLPVAHVVAIILGIIVIALLGYLIYTNFTKSTGTISEETCKAKLIQYCTLWSFCNYEPTKKDAKGSIIGGCQPNNADFYDKKNNPDCDTYKAKLGYTGNPDECRNLLNKNK